MYNRQLKLWGQLNYRRCRWRRGRQLWWWTAWRLADETIASVIVYWVITNLILVSLRWFNRGWRRRNLMLNQFTNSYCHLHNSFAFKDISGAAEKILEWNQEEMEENCQLKGHFSWSQVTSLVQSHFTLEPLCKGEGERERKVTIVIFYLIIFVLILKAFLKHRKINFTISFQRFSIGAFNILSHRHPKWMQKSWIWCFWVSTAFNAFTLRREWFEIVLRHF